MNYDKISELSQGGLALNSKFYEEYIAPLLKEKPKGEEYGFLLGQAHNAWRLSIDKKDLQLVKFIENICRYLQEKDENNLVDLFSLIFSEQYDAMVKTESADRSLWDAKVSENFESIIGSSLELYKTYFENEFRLWITLVYYYVCLIYNIKNKATSLAAYIPIGASEKFHAIKDIKIASLGGSPSDLTNGFDNRIRNCGAGHDRWEILDDNSIVLNIINSETGEKKGDIKITKKDLEESIKQCRKTIWILKIGLTVFLINNPEFEKKLKEKKAVKIKAIEEAVKVFARDRSFSVKKFELNQERTKLQISVKYEKQSVPTREQLFFGTAAAYDILYLEDDDWLHFHVLDIMQCALLHLKKEQLPELVYEVYDENDKLLAHVEFDGKELEKIFTAKEKYEPKPRSGEIPKKKITFYLPLRVPYGFVKLLGVNIIKREKFEKVLEEYKNKIQKAF